MRSSDCPGRYSKSATFHPKGIAFMISVRFPSSSTLMPSMIPAARDSKVSTRPVYRQRRPTATPPYPVVQHNLETFLAQAAKGDIMGDGIPIWFENGTGHGWVRHDQLEEVLSPARAV